MLILFAGAAKIMQEKADAVQFAADLDIDTLIREGKEKAKKSAELAEQQANRFIKDKEDCLNIDQDSLAIYDFQDKEYIKDQEQLRQKLRQEKQKKHGSSSHRNSRPMRAAVRERKEALEIAKAQELEKKAEHQQNKTNGLEILILKTKEVKLTKPYLHHFYDDFGTLEALYEQLLEYKNEKKEYPPELLELYQNHLSTAQCPAWTAHDYKGFLSAYLENDDPRYIHDQLQHRHSKEEVERYYSVFVKRFYELGDCQEQIAAKRKAKEQSELNKKTILEFDIDSLESGKCCILLQENNLFHTETNKALLCKAQQQMRNFEAQKNQRRRKYATDLDHSRGLYSKEVEEKQVEYIATALRAEQGLREHSQFFNHRHYMKAAIQRKKAFEMSYQDSTENINRE